MRNGGIATSENLPDGVTKTPDGKYHKTIEIYTSVSNEKINQTITADTLDELEQIEKSETDKSSEIEKSINTNKQQQEQQQKEINSILNPDFDSMLNPKFNSLLNPFNTNGNQ